MTHLERDPPPGDGHIADPFGIYRAEWLSDALFTLFTKPAYYPELETARPCILVGGRGTGKTTVLKCLSYEGRYALSNHDNDSIPAWPYFGFYQRVNTNRVTAFQGEELSAAQWAKLYAHYLNLTMCKQVVEFLLWFEDRVPGAVRLSPDECLDVCDSLFLEGAEDQKGLARAIGRGQRRFEAFLNNLDPEHLPSLSLQGQPVDHLCEAILRLPQFEGKSLFFVFDEFENLLDYQQEILNTLIKHCGASYTFKVGVRDLGWRRRSTLNPNEQLISPADYERIDIEHRLEGEQFVKFAAEVCNLRAKGAPGFPSGADLADMLPSLPLDQEAQLLGIGDHVSRIQASVERELPDWSATAAAMAPLDLYLVDYWARSQRRPMEEVFQERRDYPSAWSDRLNNYKVPLLFTIRGSRVGFRKYYCGWRSFTSMAGSNIRYLLELVGQALLLHQQNEQPVSSPVKPKVQTEAAIMVGRKNLAEMEGLSVHGAQLTKLLLGLGRVFEVLARHPEGHTPEITQFTLPEDAPLDGAGQLLTAAVMHLALVRTIANKRMDLDLKAYDYAVHPIYSAFFMFSHRRKRKLRISPSQLMAIVNEPRTAIRQILRAQNRLDDDYPLPEQLRLFEAHYLAS